MSRPYPDRWPIVFPLLGVVVISLAIRSLDLDQRVSSLFYDADHRSWPYFHANPWSLLYRYGTWPPVCLGLAGLANWAIGSRIWPGLSMERMNVLRRRSLFLALMLLIGPGMLVNGAIKSTWGRPRPVQCLEFGGEFPFREVGDWQPQSFANHGWPTAPPVIAWFLQGPVLSSFPSGHASIAFYLMSVAFLIHPLRRRLRFCWMCVGISYGLLMGVCRVIQGGHFPSDVLWAGIIVYLVGAVLDRIMGLHDSQSEVRSVATIPSQRQAA